jgi:hypothetical protein
MVPGFADQRGSMKKFVLAALAVLSLGVGAANAQTLSHGNSNQAGNQYNWLEGGGG